jgi:intein-encoded DNA endonuclease-like protein
LNLTDFQKGYIAGFIDGEGCITISTFSNYSFLHLYLTNNNKQVLEKIREWIGYGKVQKTKSLYGNKWFLQFNGYSCFPIFKNI